MDPKSKKIIDRFISGEKDLYRELEPIFKKYSNGVPESDAAYLDFVAAYHLDDYKALIAAKRVILSGVKKEKIKPSFESKKTSNDKKQNARTKQMKKAIDEN